MKSCLLFIYDDMTTNIINEIKKINGHNILEIYTEKEVNINDKNIEVFYSNASGVGKSTLIKDNIEKNNKKYIYFPVGGEFTREEVIKRLQNLIIDENSVIHLDLYDTNKVNLMKEFLFSLLITKSYSRGENIFYLGNKIEIKIEIPFGFVNFNQKFPILRLFKQTEIKIENLPKLKISNELTSNMQIACNYLKFYKEDKINDYNIIIKGLTSIEEGKQLNAEILNEDTCESLIKEYFKVEKSSFYQKLSFINIIASQLIPFNGNYALSTEQLKEIGREKKQIDLPKIRSFIIDALIKNTEHFTKGAYSNLIAHQEFSQNRQIGKFDEDKVLKEAIQKLEKKEYISYKQIKPSLVFCNLDGGSLSIITNCNKNEEEYKKLTQLYSSDITGTRNLIDYQNANPELFFTEIEKVLDLKSTVEKIKEIVGSWLW